MVAVVLGTALTALGPECLATQSVQASHKTISDMGRYCTTCWRNARLPADAWGDCTQEVFRRMLERVPTSAWNHVLDLEGDERREFLRAIDAVKKRTQRARKYTPAVDIVADARESSARQLNEEREGVRQAATEVLTPRQQKVLQLSFEGWAVQDIASDLDLPVERVSDEKYKAVRKLRAHLAQREVA